MTTDAKGQGDGPATAREGPGLRVEELTGKVSPPPRLPEEAGVEVEALAPRALAPGTQLGRYVVLEKLGEGGMGVVYTAYDSELRRKVALKLLRAEASESGSGGRRSPKQSSGQQRLLREAQALAQLAHPNVVGVHDVGTYGDSVFIAMEFVEGKDVRAWMKEKPRGWREVLAVFREAGKGLAAAHAKGMVHRDFKPDNVLVSTEGRVYVLDFGLARAQGPSFPAEPALSLSTDSAELLATPLTQAGAVIGTVPYMAAELLDGSPADSRSDVFAFAVSLYEALYGERPFPGRGERVLREPPAGVKVPPWLRRVVLKGLATSPEARQGSMQQMLEELGRDPAPKRRRAFFAMGFVGVMAIAAAGVRQAEKSRSQLCQGEGERLRGVWDTSVESSLREAFLLTGQADAARNWEQAAKGLRNYADALVTARTQACVDTRVKGTQTDEVFTLRMECLDRRLTDLQALTTVLSQPRGDVVDKAVEAVSNLPPLDGCDNLQALRAPVRPPEEPKKRARVDALRKEIAHVKALYDTGDYAKAKELAEPVVAEALTLGYRPLEGEALLALASAISEMDHPTTTETYRRALFAATAGKHTEVVARAAGELVWDAYRTDAFADARLWAEHAHAALEALGGNAGIESDVASGLASIAADENPNSPLSFELHERALELQIKAFGEDSPKLLFKYSNLGFALFGARRYADARGMLQRALDIGVKAYGPDHPDVSYPMAILGDLEFEDGGPTEKAEEYLRGAYRIRERRLGVNHSRSLDLLQNIVDMHAARGEYVRALELGLPALETARDIPSKGWVAQTFQKSLPRHLRALNRLSEALAMSQQYCASVRAAPKPVPQDLVQCHLALGQTLLQMGRREEALTEYQRALPLLEKHEANPFRRVEWNWMMGDWYLKSARPTEALAQYLKALEVYESRLGSEHKDVGLLLLPIGKAQLALKQYAEARSSLERAAVILPRAHLAPEFLGDARFALSQALSGGGGDVDRARALATQAMADYERSEIYDKARRLQDVRSWLVGRP